MMPIRQCHPEYFLFEETDLWPVVLLFHIFLIYIRETVVVNIHVATKTSVVLTAIHYKISSVELTLTKSEIIILLSKCHLYLS